MVPLPSAWPDSIRYDSRQAGMSLLELTIVFVIVGLLYGGILKGQDMIENARLHAALQQVQTYQMATQLFMERYGALPGDYAAPSSLMKDLKGGNGNGVVEGEGLEESSEAFLFWSHLAASQLITGVQPQGKALYGDGVPSARIGGGFTVEHNAVSQRQGLWLVLGQAHKTQGNGALLTPRQAQMIDKKIDTGNPLSGSVRAEKGEGASGPCLSGEAYDLTDTTPSCVVYFKIL